MQAKALLPIFTRKELNIDSLTIISPEIRITQLKKTDSSAEEKATISEQMGRIYNSITDALATLNVKRFEINKGKFVLEDKTEPNQKPLEISDLHLHIDHLYADSSRDVDFFSGDQMVFKTHHQSISFPDGNHKLSFSRFRINIRKRLIEIDSCTLTGKQMGNDRDSFSVFFDTVKLVKADFYALYKKKAYKS